jgi:crotonobetainyl-CoA:carnitine CoA-transferase CaiB-like acyl-CoA transferase
MMSITGTLETAPQRVGFPVSDTVGGLTAALAIAAAIAGRARDGRGCFLDVSMLEASVSAMGWPVSNYLVSGVTPRPMGDQNATAAPSGTFTTADGPLNIAANEQQQYETLCHLIGRPDLVDDPRFVDRDVRKDHRDELNREINLALGARPAADWATVLSAAGVPAARIITVPEMVELDQLTYRRFFAELPFPEVEPDDPPRRLNVSSNGVLIDGQRLYPTTPPPRLGQQNHDLAALADRWRGHAPNVVDAPVIDEEEVVR